METINTRIVSGKVEFNSPTEYDIKDTNSGAYIQNIKIQKGPVKDKGLNGIFTEDLILICIDQLEHFQASDFSCDSNAATLRHLNDALATTRSRQYERLIRNVQGKYIK